MKNGLLLLIGIIILIIVIKSKSNLSSPSTITNNIPTSNNIVSTLSINSQKFPLVPSISSISPNGILPTRTIDPDLAKLGGVLSVRQANGSYINIPFQNRDPLEAQQPPTDVVVKDFNGDPTNVLLASLPSAVKKFRLPSVSLGPSIAQQSQGLIDFYRGGFDAGGNSGGAYNPEGEFHTTFV